MWPAVRKVVGNLRLREPLQRRPPRDSGKRVKRNPRRSRAGVPKFNAALQGPDNVRGTGGRRCATLMRLPVLMSTVQAMEVEHGVMRETLKTIHGATSPNVVQFPTGEATPVATRGPGRPRTTEGKSQRLSKKLRSPVPEDFDVIAAAIRAIPEDKHAPEGTLGRRAAVEAARTVINRDSRMTKTACTIASKILDTLNPTQGRDWHGVGFYARECGVARRTAERAFARLEDGGHILRRRRGKTAAGDWETTETTLPTLARLASEGWGGVPVGKPGGTGRKTPSDSQEYSTGTGFQTDTGTGFQTGHFSSLQPREAEEGEIEGPRQDFSQQEKSSGGAKDESWRPSEEQCDRYHQLYHSWGAAASPGGKRTPREITDRDLINAVAPYAGEPVQVLTQAAEDTLIECEAVPFDKRKGAYGGSSFVRYFTKVCRNHIAETVSEREKATAAREAAEAAKALKLKTDEKIAKRREEAYSDAVKKSAASRDQRKPATGSAKNYRVTDDGSEFAPDASIIKIGFVDIKGAHANMALKAARQHLADVTVDHVEQALVDVSGFYGARSKDEQPTVKDIIGSATAKAFEIAAFAKFGTPENLCGGDVATVGGESLRSSCACLSVQFVESLQAKYPHAFDNLRPEYSSRFIKTWVMEALGGGTRDFYSYGRTLQQSVEAHVGDVARKRHEKVEALVREQEREERTRELRGENRNRLTPADGSSWKAWVCLCREQGRGDIAEAAEQRGEMWVRTWSPNGAFKVPTVLTE